MDEKDSRSKPLPFSSVLLFIAVFCLGVFITIIMMLQYKFVFIDKVEFANYSHLVLVGISVMLVALLVLYEAYFRNIKKDFKPTEGHMRLAKYIIYFMGFSLLAGPFVIRPSMNMYMKSQGYEYCPGTRSALSKAQSQNWAKPSVGCEVWELSDEERKAIRENRSS